MRRRTRWVVLRTAWLLVGAAIGLAAVLLLVGLAQVIAPSGTLARAGVTALCLLPALLLGLLPGVRELEVTAGRTLLGVTGELMAPERQRAQHRWRSVLLVTFHLTAGLLAGLLLVGGLPATVAVAAGSLAGEPVTVAGFTVAPGPDALVVLLAAAAVVGCLVSVWGLGSLSAGVAARLLGPTAADRLEVALARLEAESEHTRLARELHDGIGHALSIITVQAAAGRRALGRDPEQAGAALGSIEDTSRQALDELDDMLGLLRGSETPRAPEPDLDRLPALLSSYRSAGMQLEVDAPPLPRLPRLVSSTAYRIVAEALANAQRHGGPGPVVLLLHRAGGLLTVEVRSRLREQPADSRRSGRGLTGAAERVRLFGGCLTAGPAGPGWVLRAEIPTGPAGD